MLIKVKFRNLGHVKIGEVEIGEVNVFRFLGGCISKDGTIEKEEKKKKIELKDRFNSYDI